MTEPTADSSTSNHFSFQSRCSPVVCRHVASSIALDFLRRGANAADCAVAVAAVLAVTESYSTGLGGDLFCLYYKAVSAYDEDEAGADQVGVVSCINGSGKIQRP
jgi:gamma-glutamyltranspeptidase